MKSVMQRLYDSEINANVASFWDGGFDVRLGDRTNGFKDHTDGLRDWTAVEAWLTEMVLKHYPDSQFAKEERAAPKAGTTMRFTAIGHTHPVTGLKIVDPLFRLDLSGPWYDTGEGYNALIKDCAALFAGTSGRPHEEFVAVTMTGIAGLGASVNRSIGLAPLKEEGKPACGLCDSTACEHVGGPEQCTVSPIFQLTPMGDGNQVYRCTACGLTPEQVRVGGHAKGCKHQQVDHTHDSGELPRR